MTDMDTMTDTVPVFPHPQPQIRRISPDRPWAWLRAGWQDFMKTPAIGLSYGLMVAVAGALIIVGFWMMDTLYLVLPMAAGFMLIGPLGAVGLYETSRRLRSGEPVGLGRALMAWRRNGTQIALIGFMLTLALLFWVRIATLLFALFFGQAGTDVAQLVEQTFLSIEGIPFVIVGTAVGAVLAAVVFSISAISIPMLLDRDTDAVSAVISSLRAVQVNVVPMAVWAGLIVVFTAAGIALLFIGLAVTLPLVGHATWHAYRDLVQIPDSAPVAGGD